uniref:Transmembrane protein n=1 Tax=Fagus sylvatica TaxID=28930 RepID=A0A2N9HT70_FAGSY
MRTPGVPVFGQKKKIRYVLVGSGQVRAEIKRRRFRLKTEAPFSFSATPFSSLSLQPDSLSSALCFSLPPPPVSSVFSPLLSVTVSALGFISSALCLGLCSRFSLFCSLSLLCSLSLSLLSVNGYGLRNGRGSDHLRATASF